MVRRGQYCRLLGWTAPRWSRPYSTVLFSSSKKTLRIWAIFSCFSQMHGFLWRTTVLLRSLIYHFGLWNLASACPVSVQLRPHCVQNWNTKCNVKTQSKQWPFYHAESNWNNENDTLQKSSSSERGRSGEMGDNWVLLSPRREGSKVWRFHIKGR